MHDVFQDHYLKDPQHRFSHIPSIPVTIPVATATQMNLCYSSRYSPQQLVVTGEDIRATAAALLEAVRQLELDSDAQTIQQTNQESGGKPLHKFFIKRNYSGTVWQVTHNCSGCTKRVRLLLSWELQSPNAHPRRHTGTVLGRYKTWLLIALMPKSVVSSCILGYCWQAVQSMRYGSRIL